MIRHLLPIVYDTNVVGSQELMISKIYLNIEFNIQCLDHTQNVSLLFSLHFICVNNI